MGFALDGNQDGVRVANATNLQLQDFTIEAWIERASASIATFDSSEEGLIFGYGSGGYGLGVDSAGRPLLTQVDVQTVKAPGIIIDTLLHHLAVTKSGTNVVFFVDGMPYSVTPYGAVFDLSTVPAIGARGDNMRNSFLGVVDEVSVYNRALGAPEIQAIYNAAGFGKCVGPLPPLIALQPTNQTVNSGSSATFSVGAMGAEPLSYQWQFNGSPVLAATESVFNVVSAQPADAGTYSVLVTNAYGTMLSSNATLTVLFPPAIVTQPQSQTVLAGTNVILSVTVTSSPPSACQWKFNGTNLAGATTTALTLTNVQLKDAGNYSLAATNSLGYALSSNATLTVHAPPSVTVQPQGQVGFWGRSITMTVGAQGTAPFTYLWYKDGIPIVWATNSILILNDLELTAGGSYRVVVSNSFGNFTSASALLVVNPAGISLGLYPGVAVEGAVGKTYGIQYVTNVSNASDWTTLATLILTQTVQLWFDADADVTAGRNPHRFYRVIAVP
jgi:hypothetical protein